MLFSVNPTNEYFEKKTIYIPATASWEIVLNREAFELGEELEDYWTYGLYLKCSDVVNSCIFHSELIERETEEYEAEDEDIRWLFDLMQNVMFQEIGNALKDQSEMVDLGVVIDECLEDWKFHMACKKKQKETQ